LNATAITINRCTDSWTDWYCNDHAHNASRGHDPNRIDYNGDRGRDRNDCHSVRLDNDYSANGRLDRSNTSGCLLRKMDFTIIKKRHDFVVMELPWK
jgi:hypothetical protein